MDTIIKKLKYNNYNFLIFKDKNNKVWFNASQMCRILGYVNPNDTIKLLVNKKHVKRLKNIFNNYKIYPNAQPDSLYLNESGLYSLLIRSKKPNAEKFFLWVVEKVLPSIRKTGSYFIDTKTKEEFDNLNKIIEEKNAELKEKNLKILTLENNQKNKHICIKGSYIYILKSTLDDYINENMPDILKIGKTKKYKIRIATYNTGQKDNTIVLYRVKINDISAVENCLKGLLSKKVYRSYREYYNITLKEAIQTIKKCIKLTGSELISEDKFYRKYKIKRSNVLKGFNYGISNDLCEQNGGSRNTLQNISDNITIQSYEYYNGIYDLFNDLMNNLKHVSQ